MSPRPHSTAFCGALAVLIMASILASGCTPSQTDDVLATSDLGPVSEGDLERYILSLSEEKRRPDADQSFLDWRRAKVEDLLLARALTKEAETLLDRPGARAAVQKARYEALVGVYVDHFVNPAIDISDEALRRYYDEHPDEFGHPEQIRLRHIYRRVDSDATPAERAAVRAEFEKLLASLRDGANFGDLARTESDSETAYLHGLIGRLDRGQLDPKLEEIVWNLEEGEISDIVETPVGFHIFRLDNHIAPSHLAFDEAKGRLARKLQKLRSEQIFAENFKSLLAESGATYRPEVLEARDVVEPAEVLFKLDDHVITMQDVNNYRRNTSFSELRAFPANVWLENAVRNRLFVWKAEQEGLDQDPTWAPRIDAAERDAMVRLGTESKVDELLVTLDADGSLEAYYLDNLRRFQSPVLHRPRIIRCDFTSFDRPLDAREFLVELANKIESGELDMADAARRHSDDPSASNGGDIGWIRLDEIGKWAGPRAQNAVAYLKPGELSEPLLIEVYDRPQLRYDRTGFFLIRIEEIRESDVIPFDLAKEKVSRSYLERHRPELELQVRDAVLTSIHARILEENL